MRIEIRSVPQGEAIVIDVPDDGHFITVAEVNLATEHGEVIATKRLYVARQDRHNKIHLAD